MIRSYFSAPLRSPIFLALVLLAIHPPFCDAASIPSPKAKHDQMKNIESKLSREKEKFEAFHSEERDLLGQLSTLEQEVAQKRDALEDLKKRVRLTRGEVKKLQEKLRDLERSLIKAEMVLAKRLVALYKYARRGYVRILANARDLDQFWQRVKYLKAIMETDRVLLKELAEEKDKHNKEILRIREQVAEREAVRNEISVQMSFLKKDLEKKVIRLVKVHKEKEFYETAVKELKLAALGLKKTLSNIEEKGGFEGEGSFRFAEFKGQLTYPLEGKIIRSDKLLGASGLKFPKSIFIEGATDTKVKAVFPGRVDFSGLLKGYGQIIVINHGSRFFTIYGYLSERKREGGDVVGGGEVIGLAGRIEASNRVRIYFEIRRAGKTLDPLEWLKVR